LLETGNWTDSGHPTGRRVTFTNSFAIEGHYFNFSTSGQWLWDELTLVLASSQNPYPIVEAIQKAVLDATAESSGQAEKEWQHAAHSWSMRALSAAPAINVKPVSGGVEIAVRYIGCIIEQRELPGAYEVDETCGDDHADHIARTHRLRIVSNGQIRSDQRKTNSCVRGISLSSKTSDISFSLRGWSKISRIVWGPGSAEPPPQLS